MKKDWKDKIIFCSGIKSTVKTTKKEMLKTQKFVEDIFYKGLKSPFSFEVGK